MALRLRRGTNAERQLITPLQGELIYTTDTKALFIGDGTTVGGVLVQGSGGGATQLSDLSDVSIGSLSNGNILQYESATSLWKPTNNPSITFGNLDNHDDVLYPAGGHANGDVLLSDGVNFIPSALENSQFKMSIAGADSSVLVDHLTNRFNGNLTGDVQKVDGYTLIDTSTQTANGLKLKADNGTVAYDPTLRQFFGDIQGIHQGDVYSSTASGTIKLLDHTTGLFYGDISGGSIFADDSSLLLSTDTSTLYGDVKGSVHADDSSVMVDSVAGKIRGAIETTLEADFDSIVNIGKNIATDPKFNYYSTQHGAFGDSVIQLQNIGDTAVSNEMGFSKFRGTATNRQQVQVGDNLGGIGWAAANSTGAAIVAGSIRMVVTVTSGTYSVSADTTIFTRNGLIANYSEALRIRADKVTAASGAVKLVNYADTTARDSAIPTPETGMMVYITATHKAQVYANSTWVDLH